jgi:hypothetical protein
VKLQYLVLQAAFGNHHPFFILILFQEFLGLGLVLHGQALLLGGLCLLKGHEPLALNLLGFFIAEKLLGFVDLVPDSLGKCGNIDFGIDPLQRPADIEP